MKCLCGYERSDSWDAPEEEEKFITLKVIFIQNEYDLGPSPKRLYACPKCGTVKVDYP